MSQDSANTIPEELLYGQKLCPYLQSLLPSMTNPASYFHWWVRLILANDFLPGSEQIFEDLNKPRVGTDGYGHQSFANGSKHIQIFNSIGSILPSQFLP
jgi:hypothetical protein